jgi:TonB family protein
VPIHQVVASYPLEAQATRQQAQVTVLATVAVDGSVTAVETTGPADEPFNREALAAARQWRFKPATNNGQPIESQVRIPFRFRAPAPNLTLAEPSVNSDIEPPPAPLSPSGPGAPPPAAAGGAPAQAPKPSTAPVPPAELDQTTQAAPAKNPFEVVVAAKRQPPATRGASDFHVEVGALSAVPRKTASELLKLAPGILLTNDGSEAHADQVFLRGFDAREGQDIEFTVGGTPINESGNLHGNGYADTHFIIPELVSGLRILEGPFDPRQGNYAVAGSADYELGLAQRGITAKFMAGSFGTYRTLLLWGPAGAREGTFAGIELYQTDGFGQNRDGRRATAMAQYEGKKGEHLYHITATAYIASFHSAGVLREDDYQAGRVGFFDTYDTRQGADTSRYTVSGDLESKLGRFVLRNQVFGIVRPATLRENFTGFLLDTQEPTQSPHGQRGDLIELEAMEFTLGARGSGRLSGEVFHQTQELEVGYYARGDFVSSSQRRVEASTGHPYHIETDLTSRLGDIGLYFDFNLKPVSWIAVRGGLRSDLFTFDVVDNCAVQSVSHPSKTNPPGDQSCLSQQDFGRYREPTQRATSSGAALLPRVSLILGPLLGISAAVSYGQGVRSIDPIYITQDAKTPFASAASVDAGLSFVRRFGSLGFNIRSAFFQTRVDRDLIFSQTVGRNVLSNGTTRLGSASAVRLTGGFFDIAANFTYVKATFDDTGLLIPYVPDRVFRLDGSLFGTVPFQKLRIRGRAFRGTLATGITYVAPRPLPQGEFSNPIFTLDLNATLGIWLFDVGFIATNLLDNQYRLGEYNYASDFHSQAFPTLVPVRQFSAGAPRSLFFTISVNFGGGR